MAQVGDIVGGKYRLDRQLGEGGMGTVFEAENLNTGRRVAVKVLHGEWVTLPEVTRRFVHEARATTAIAHPNIVEVFDLDTDVAQGVVYIVQELLAGDTLEAFLSAQPERRVSVTTALEVLLPVMSALVAAHARGIVHRDIKPANILLVRGRGGEMVPKVIDFGIAKDVGASATSTHNTQVGLALGTPSYMSPEQVAGLPDIDAQSDVWSLGVLLYEMLSGRLPYEAANTNLILGKILYEAPTPLEIFLPELSPGVREIVHNCLQRERSQRFRSVRAMLAAVLELEERPHDLRPGLLPPPTEPERTSPPPPQPAVVPETEASPAPTSQTIETISREVPTESAPQQGSGRRGVGVAVAVVLAGVTLAVGWSMRAPAASRPATAASGPVVAPPLPTPSPAHVVPPVPLPTTTVVPLAEAPPPATVVAQTPVIADPAPALRPTRPTVVRTRVRAAQVAAPSATVPRAVAPQAAVSPVPTPRGSSPRTPRLRADEM